MFGRFGLQNLHILQTVHVLHILHILHILPTLHILHILHIMRIMHIMLIMHTRSYAALRAADLDWIVGPGYSLRRVHSGEKP